jgi:hypothetical protein
VVELDDNDLAHMKNLHIGKTSGAMLVQAAIYLKHEYTGKPEHLMARILGARRPEFWTVRPVRNS